MKKNISINLQGLVFHIEEDGHDVLQRYLHEVKAYFSTYRGHEEIVADIEGRFAEIFAARLSPTKQVITLEDVQAVVTKMGRVQDFQQDGALDDDDDVADAASYGQPLGGQAYAGTATARPATAPPPVQEEPRRLYRDMSNRRVAGVAAGLARYFNVNPLWLRLGFVLTLLSPIIGDFVGALPAISFLTYVVLWIALPKRYGDDRPMPDDDVTRKLFRDPDNGTVGGVSAGLAHYLGIEVAIVRIVFILSIFLGGTGLFLYLILWMVVPPAVTLAQKAQMRGEALTLSGLENSLRNPQPAANRPVGAFLEEVARALRPLARVMGLVVRVFVGLIFILVGFSLLMGLMVLAGVALGLMPDSQNITLGDGPAYAVLAGIPWWFAVSGFLAAGIPVLLLLFSGVGLISRRWLLGRTATLVLLGLWILGVVGSIMGGVRYAQEFQEEGYHTATRNLGTPTGPSILLDARSLDRDWSMRPDLQLVAADSGVAGVTLVEEYSAHGRTEADGAASARTSISYRAVLRDSTVTLDDHFSLRPGAVFRDQNLDLTLRLPRGKRIRLAENFVSLLDDEDFVDDQRPNSASKHVYELVGRQLRCLDCAADDLPGRDGDEDRGEADIHIGDMRVHVDADDEDVRISMDDEEERLSFSTDPADYGSGEQSFQYTDFNDIDVAGAYRLVVRHADNYSVRAYGPERALRNLRAESPGSELNIAPRGRGFFNFNNRGEANNRVLIVVETPELSHLDLSGAVQAQVSGFEDLGNLRVDQTGASHLSFEGNCRSLSLDLAGACRTALRGRAERLDIDGSGVCQVLAANFPVERAKVELNGASKARLNVSGELNTDVSGASRVEYSGGAAKVRTEKSGAARVQRVE